ncbi:Spore cortex-lytic enzyme [[Clostridium] ultunense Esp]|uniref:spore cortex-lytic enzyme n=1 Tax=Thermicanus aegyptius TaxID=94009 RepID=UPI0002B6FBC3|nr:spore cortex-lytic enzyme [Thermicanus aegyptius]CCQ96104.1 Spore cortex-lytic enzyme [[Clostridium] ultunense Esp]
MLKRLLLVILALTVGILFILVSPIPSSYKGEGSAAFGKQTLYVGARGGDVYELQGRLKYLGYYTGKIDGVFGWRTYWAVRNFQYNFGMKVDGIVGSKTKYKLWKATKNWRPGGTAAGGTPTRRVARVSTGSFSANDIRLMANAVYGEARGEPYEGQVAVAAVILNRMEHPSFPKTPAGVIFEPGAFTAVADGQIWLTPNETAKKAVLDAINGWDPSGGAIYYFNPATATSAWIWSRPQIKRIGKHIFCK